MLTYKNNISILFAGWLLTLLIVNFLFHAVEATRPNVMLKCILLGPQAWPVILYLFYPPFKTSISKLFFNWPFIIFLLLFSISSYLSFLHPPLPLIALTYILSIISLLVLSFSFSASMSNEEMRQGLVLYGLFGSMILIIYAFYYCRPSLNSFRYFDQGSVYVNYLGAICASIIMVCLLSKNMWIKIISILPASGILFLTNSRGSIISLLLGLIIWRLLIKKPVFTPLIRKISPAIFVFAAVLLVFDRIDVLNFAAKYFRITQGDWTNWTHGRSRLWLQTWNLFKSSPVAGVWYKTDPSIIHLSTVHRIFRILTETGIIGIMPIGYFFFRALANYFGSHKDIFVSFAIGFIMANLFLGIFENYLFTTGGKTASMIVSILLVRGFANHHTVKIEN